MNQPVVTPGATRETLDHQKRYAKMRAREDAHAAMVQAKNPPPPVKFQHNQRVRVVGRAVARDPQAGIHTDHRGALGDVHSTYVDSEGARRAVLRTEDGVLRAVPQDSCRLASERKSAAVSGDGLPRYLSIGMDRQFCGERCDPDGRRHCLDDHEANEAAYAASGDNV